MFKMHYQATKTFEVRSEAAKGLIDYFVGTRLVMIWGSHLV
jgi:hypothetical protein